jgi:hypothetical protein
MSDKTHRNKDDEQIKPKDWLLVIIVAGTKASAPDRCICQESKALR